MRFPLLPAAVAAAALTLLGAAAPAVADTNRNVHSPSLLCGPGPLTLSGPDGTESECLARQLATQRITESGTSSVSLLDYVAAAVPATVG
ncbi:hypothetical protein V1J52_01155 [Streptomyces sp. TRM 70351]|uniref:hypothetical protein n=1 Tax=Streptomyces sp. TRM 70351 TaxID=3116552 RepID=UPI002E7C5072|nr:hypothetical protein [Streptomyces sp. TRM 70351]MEE1926801.1 hypothetical protein [Streptomyces sp. TRM 70351]